MAGDEWNSMGCGSSNDEWSCVQLLGQDAADAAFRTHWQTWITPDDLKEIQSYGLNTVRIPVGFWINEDLVNDGEYYPRGGLEYLDYVVGNCTQLGLYVIMDLHGGPGSQFPGQQYTGHAVDSPGFYTADNYERAYKFLEWMTERVHTNSAYFNVGMLQVINEPVHAGDYPSQAADMIANYYPTAWTRIRNREAQLNVADNEKLHIEYMVCIEVFQGTISDLTLLPGRSLGLWQSQPELTRHHVRILRRPSLLQVGPIRHSHARRLYLRDMQRQQGRQRPHRRGVVDLGGRRRAVQRRVRHPRHRRQQ